MLTETKYPFPTELALKSIHSHRGREGATLDAKIHLNGKHVGDVLDEGNGGEVEIHFFVDGAEKTVLDLLESVAFPPMMWKGREIKPEDMRQERLENWIEASFSTHENKKAAARLIKKGYKVVVALSQDVDFASERLPLDACIIAANSLDACLKGQEAKGFTHYEVIHDAA